jgi:VanZ family protein
MQPMKYHQTGSLRKALWLAALASSVVLASSCPMPGWAAALHFRHFDKVAHFLVFGLLATLVARIPWVQRRRPLGIYTAIALVSVFGATDELHQHFTPSRSMDVWDWVTDTLGAALAVGIYAQWHWYRATLERPVAELLKRRVEIGREPCVIPGDGIRRGETTDRGLALAGRAA